VEYTVKKNLAGRHRVHFQCSHCNSVLESPLEEAGQEFDCPICGKRIATPGQPDLAKLRAAVESRQKAMEEERRVSQERAASVGRRDAAARKEEEARRERERLEAIDKLSFADRLLSLAFKFAKAVSVIVIISCFFTVAVCLAILPTVQPVKVSQATAPMLAPSLAEYKEYMKPASDTVPTGTGNQPTAPNNQTPLTRFEALLQPFDLNSYSRSAEFIEMDSYTQQALIAGLGGFIHSFQADTAAVNWYLETFKARLTACG
jgi:predicted RNA-binding Zn-ribbon protein involved in translation (DUF1610 family)